MENSAQNIFIEIEKIYIELLPKNFIFKKVKYWIYVPLLILTAASFSLMYYLPETYNNFFWLIYSIIILVTFLEIYILNKYAKRKLKALGISTNENRFSSWNSSQFQKIRIFKFYESLRNNFVLSKNDSNLNIKLLDEYQKYFIEKSRKKEWETQIKGIATTILLFILPFWNLVAQNITQSENRIPYEIIFSIILSIACVYIVRNQAIRYLDNDSYKYENISQLILNLKWNLELKNFS
ncbi:MAG: hypothetical protein Q4G16_07005 [Cruoricaptor ignavus]|nr:hypothetical protein [Cruoricaptor ignavus]